MAAADTLDPAPNPPASPSPPPAPRPPAPDYARFFEQRILRNAHYWRDFLNDHGEDIAALDGERDGIVQALGYALDVAEAWPPAYEVMTQFSPYLERRGTWEGWNLLLEQATRQAEAGGDLAAAVTLSTLLARLCQRQSRPAETIQHYRRVIRLARRIDDDFSLGRACTNLGYLYVEQGRWWRAEILCCAALAVFERIGSDYGCAHTENHLGILYVRQCLWEQAKPHLERACMIWQEMGDTHGMMRGFINQSVLYLEIEHPNPDEALVFLEKALQQARLTGEEGEIGRIYHNLGLAYWLKGDLAQAEAYSLQAEAIFQHFSNWAGLAGLYENLGGILTNQARWKKAQLYLNTSLMLYRSQGNKLGEIGAQLAQASYHLARGEKRRAAHLLKELEPLIQHHGEAKQRRLLQELLAEYQRGLGAAAPKTAEAGPTPAVE